MIEKLDNLKLRVFQVHKQKIHIYNWQEEINSCHVGITDYTTHEKKKFWSGLLPLRYYWFYKHFFLSFTLIWS